MMTLLLLAAAMTQPHGWLGMRYSWRASPPRGHVLRVESVTPRGPADAARLKPDDLITTINGRAVDFGDELDLLLYLGDRKPGEHVRIGLIREGKPRHIDLILGNLSAAGEAAWERNLELARRRRAARP